MNVPAILTAFKLFRDPSLILPHQTVPTFAHLPVPLSKAFTAYQRPGSKPIEIRAVVLDKDNCFAIPKTNDVHPSCGDKFNELLKTYSASNILIVSNSSGLASKDPSGDDAALLEKSTGVKVLRHTESKPSCKEEIMAHFGDRVTSASQIAVIGDRLFTDVMMANLMGSYSIWIRDGVIPDRGLVTRFEHGLSSFLTRRGWQPPVPEQ